MHFREGVDVIWVGRRTGNYCDTRGNVGGCAPWVGLSVGSRLIAMWRTLRQYRAHPVQITRRTTFSKHDRVGCEANAAPSIGVASDWQLLNQIIAQARSVITVRITAGDRVQALAYKSPECVFNRSIFPNCRASTMQPANLSVRCGRSSQAFSRIAPPSQLP